MTKQKKSSEQGPKAGRLVIGRAAFAKISAVEGIRPTAAMDKRAEDRRTKGLSAEEYRRAIISSHRKG
jgi:hypothetical protein